MNGVLRMEKGSATPVGADVSRGGAANGPAAVYKSENGTSG